MIGKWFWAILFCTGMSLSAVPYTESETFRADLSPMHWSVFGKKENFSSGNGTLTVKNDSGPHIFNYYFYPRYRAAARPAFGNFDALAELDLSACSVPVRWGVHEKLASGCELEIDPRAGTAVLVVFENGKESRFPRSAEFDLHKKLRLELKRRDGALFFSVNGISAGCWKGSLPSTMNFSLRTLKSAPGSRLKMTKWKISPAITEPFYTTLLPNPGKQICSEYEPSERNTRSGKNNGYLWKAGEKPVVAIAVSSFQRERAELILKTEITDSGDRPVCSEAYPVVLEPKGKTFLRISLPDRRFGYFNLHTTLCSKEGKTLENTRSTGFAIVRRKEPGELSADSVFGTHGNFFAGTGVKFVRFWDVTKAFFWPQVERKKGEFQFAPADALVNKTLSAGMVPLVVLAGTAEWAAMPSGRRKDTMGPPRDVADWANYCRRMAEHFKGRVRFYEIWNEPNGNTLGPRGFFFHSDAEHYFELMKAAYEAVKAVDPSARILAPSGTGHFFPFLNRIMELGGGKYFDILSIHTYCTPFPPEIGYPFNNEKEYAHRVRKSREIMRKFGFEKPIWNTEIGYHSGLDARFGKEFITQDQIAENGIPEYWPNWSKGWSFRPLDPRRAAAFVVRFGILSKVYDVKKVFFHHRLSNEGGSPFHPAPAVAWANNVLDGATFLRRIPTEEKNVHLYEFKRKDGSLLWTVWQVYPESLLMSEQADRQLKNIDSAPVAGIADQKAMDSKALKYVQMRLKYFAPGSRKKITMDLSSLPEKGMDLWGNPLALSRKFEIREEPLYLIFRTAPGRIVLRKTPLEEEPERKIRAFHGSFSDGSEVPVRGLTVRDLFPDRIFYNLRKGVVSAGVKWDRKSWLCLHAGQSIELAAEKKTPRFGRIVIEARTSGNSPAAFRNHYKLFQSGKEIPLEKCTLLPPVEIMKGKTWILSAGYLFSEELELSEPVVVRAEQNDSHIFSVAAVPSLK